MNATAPGKLIVIEGGDGSGKATQSKLLIEYLQSKNIPHQYLDFPDYDSFFGKMVAQFLRGEYGDLNQVSPYLAGLLFALDRKLVKDNIVKALSEGKIIVANRYVTSNIAHQGSKILDSAKREEFIRWLHELEYTVHGLPEPDAVFFLHVPWQTAHSLTTQKNDRTYLNGKTLDIQEADMDHRQQTEELYKKLATDTDRWTTISCLERDTIKPKEAIHHIIVDILQKKHII